MIQKIGKRVEDLESRVRDEAAAKIEQLTAERDLARASIRATALGYEVSDEPDVDRRVPRYPDEEPLDVCFECEQLRKERDKAKADFLQLHNDAYDEAITLRKRNRELQKDLAAAVDAIDKLQSERDNLQSVVKDLQERIGAVVLASKGVR
jgi:hypothetical protein